MSGPIMVDLDEIVDHKCFSLLSIGMLLIDRMIIYY
jgi:hypothetical protein